MSDPEIRYLGDVQRLQLGPDDLLVLTTDQHLSSAALDRIRAAVESTIPGQRVVVLTGGMKLGVLSKEPPSTTKEDIK